MIRKPKLIEKIMDHIFLAMLALTEVCCVIATIKCFSIPSLRRGVPLVILCLVTHATLITSIVLLLGEHWLRFSLNACAVLEDFILLNIDFFQLTFAWRMLLLISLREKKNKWPKIMIKFIWIAMPVHVIVLFCIDTFFFSTEFGLWHDYMIGVQGIIGLFYLYSCIKSLRYWKNAKREIIESFNLMFVIALYMIFVITIRLSYHIGVSSSILITLNKLHPDLFVIYTTLKNIFIAMIPSLLISYLLFKLGLECSSANETNTESLIDC